MATAQSYQVNLPSTQVPGYPSDEFGGYATGSAFYHKIGAAFGGPNYGQQYQNLLTQNNREWEKAMLQEQRDYDEYVRNREYEREDSKIQRLIADYKAAGINPWLALQGGISGTTAQGQPASNGNFSNGSSAKKNDSKESAGALATLLVAAAKIITLGI